MGTKNEDLEFNAVFIALPVFKGPKDNITFAFHIIVEFFIKSPKINYGFELVWSLGKTWYH